MINDCTILQVSWNSAPWLRLNRTLMQTTNPDWSGRWLVVENSSVDSEQRLTQTDAGFDCISGVSADNKLYSKSSQQHGAGLNIGLREIKTRYVLIMDPDFFVIRLNWLDDVLTHMQKNSIDVLGVARPVYTTDHYRYFPSVLCMVIDSKNIDLTKLDMMPKFRKFSVQKLGQVLETFVLGKFFASQLKSKDAQKIYTKHPQLQKLASMRMIRRPFIGVFRDTGWQFYKDYHNRVASECVSEVYQPKSYPLDRFLPDRLSIVPKKTGYFTTKGFEHFGYPETFSYCGWDTYTWQQQPFGFHVVSSGQFKLRLERKNVLTKDEHLDKVASVIEWLDSTRTTH